MNNNTNNMHNKKIHIIYNFI